jgi:hypothetical protein
MYQVVLTNFEAPIFLFFICLLPWTIKVSVPAALLGRVIKNLMLTDEGTKAGLQNMWD